MALRGVLHTRVRTCKRRRRRARALLLFTIFSFLFVFPFPCGASGGMRCLGGGGAVGKEELELPEGDLPVGENMTPEEARDDAAP